MTIRIYIAIIIVLSAPFLLSSTTRLSTEIPMVIDAPVPKTVLFVGNSLTNYNHSVDYHTRKLVESVYPQDALQVYFKSISISGGYLADHVLGARALIMDYENEKKHGPWDVVVLQGHSRESIKALKVDRFEAAAYQLDAWSREAGSHTVLFMTWAYEHKPDMAPQLVEAYTALGNDLDALVAPVGLAFDMARNENTKIKLYAEDQKHPSLLGTYLTANVFFATLYGKSPEGASYRAGLGREEATFAQHIAWKTVQAYFGKERD